MHVRHLVGLTSVLALSVPACFETKIVESKDGDGGSGNSSQGTGGSGGTGSGIDYDACFTCAESACPDQVSSCEAAEGCNDLVRCLISCGSGDPTCGSECTSTNASAGPAATLLAACAYQNCTSECAPSLGTGGAFPTGGTGGVTGGAGGMAGGAASGATGGAGGSGGSGASGGTSSGGTGGGSGGSGGSVGGTGGSTTGIQWLTIEEDWADANVPPNDTLGINGAFYAYADECASLYWDPVTRCASGILCDPGLYYENWGVAVGFDFRNTGEEGDPPDTKLTWNPSAVGARGIAWQISGSAPGLQVWILNMDPSWSGQCSADSCEIAGPPDGTATAALNDQLLFNNMQKDDWGGSGTYYVFDPADVHAMQFKLPAIIAGGSSFNFCIDRVGIVL